MPKSTINLERIEVAFFNYDTDGSEPEQGVWEEKRRQWFMFKEYLLSATVGHLSSENATGP